ncbi:hypothetical protein N1851_034021 [Merluccius polli]|uniref:Uncharacterized protein n=1 Tax=Merluccius polli TaxID=89951 RepID=A0AA47M0C8_MERPO|nr:hypothetical protein N1851_034021 [Merluccius polli]
MNLQHNAAMHPQLRDEETLVIENAIRLAIDSIINVLYSVNGARSREYERVLADRDREIRRLSVREKDFERELRLVRRQGCSCRLYGGGGDDDDDQQHCSAFPGQDLQDPDCGEPRPGCGGGGGDGDEEDDDGGADAADEMAAAAAAAHGQCEISFSLGLFDASPSQVSIQSQDLAAPLPAIRPAFQPTPVSHTPESVDPLEGKQTLSSSLVIKEEPSDMDAICESSDGHSRTGNAGIRLHDILLSRWSPCHLNGTYLVLTTWRRVHLGRIPSLLNSIHVSLTCVLSLHLSPPHRECMERLLLCILAQCLRDPYFQFKRGLRSNEISNKRLGMHPWGGGVNI